MLAHGQDFYNGDGDSRDAFSTEHAGCNDRKPVFFFI
jgi:hypothetical protein